MITLLLVVIVIYLINAISKIFGYKTWLTWYDMTILNEAFDTLDCQIRLKKFHNYGITGPTL